MKRINPRRRNLLLVMLFCATLEVLSAVVPSAFAATPVTIVTGANSTALTQSSPERWIQYCSAYYVAFYWDGTFIQYIASATGAAGTWSNPIAIVKTAAVNQFNAYCDTSGNIYMIAGTTNSSGTMKYIPGTVSGGVITKGTVVSLTCVNGGTWCGLNPSIWGFDTTHVMMAMNAYNGVTEYTEVWGCFTSACTVAGHWAAKLDDSVSNSADGVQIVALDSNADWAVLGTNGGSFVRTTTNSGGAWAAVVSTATNLDPFSFSCISAGTTTVYCSGMDVATHKKLYFDTFVLGAGSWTETNIDTFGSATPGNGNTQIGTDATNLLITYLDPTRTNLDQILSTNMGTNWGARVPFVTGEATNIDLSIQGGQSLQSGNMAVTWQLATSNNVRFGITSGAISGCASVTLCSTGSFTVSINSVIVVAIESNNAGQTVSTVTDSLGNTYTQRVSSNTCNGGGPCAPASTIISNFIWDAPSTFTGTGTVTVTMSGSTQQIQIQIYVIQGVSNIPTCVGIGASLTSTSMTAGASGTNGQPCSVPAGGWGIAALQGLGNFALSAGAGYTLNVGSNQNMASQSQQFTQVGGSFTSFPATISNADTNLDVGIVLAPNTSSASGLGSCPTKNTATFTPANSTQYFYTTTAQQNVAFGTIKLEIASVNSGHASTEPFQIAVYATSGVGGISATNPFSFVIGVGVTLTATSAPQAFTWQVPATPNIPAGATIGISLLTNSKVLINQSSLSGLLTGASSTPTVVSASFTSLTGVTSELYFCGTLNYQSVVTTTVVITQSASTTTTTTVTSTVSVINSQTLFASNQNWPLIFLLLVLPSGLFLGITRNLAGGVVGLMIGAVICIMTGIIPVWVFTGIVISIVALAFITSRTGGGGDS